MIAVNVTEMTWRTGKIPAADTNDEIEMVTIRSGWTVDKMNPHLWSYCMDLIRTYKKKI